MSGKAAKPKHKIADITPTKKPVRQPIGEGLPQLIIENRAQIRRPGDLPHTHTPDAGSAKPAVVEADTEAATPASAPELPPKMKHAIITPVTPLDHVEPEKTEKVAVKTTVAEPKPAPAPDTAATAPTKAPDPSPSETATDEVPSQPDKQADDTDAEQAKADARAMLEARREAQLNKYIDSKEFYVPINASARKHSIKVTLWLVLVYILLSMLLINLLLDTGMILLLQKIPHTNFF